jgi:hypothetical protein
VAAMATGSGHAVCYIDGDCDCDTVQASLILGLSPYAKTLGKREYDEDQVHAVLHVTEQLADGGGSDK